MLKWRRQLPSTNVHISNAPLKPSFRCEADHKHSPIVRDRAVGRIPRPCVLEGNHGKLLSQEHFHLSSHLYPDVKDRTPATNTESHGVEHGHGTCTHSASVSQIYSRRYLNPPQCGGFRLPPIPSDDDFKLSARV